MLTNVRLARLDVISPGIDNDRYPVNLEQPFAVIYSAGENMAPATYYQFHLTRWTLNGPDLQYLYLFGYLLYAY